MVRQSLKTVLQGKRYLLDLKVGVLDSWCNLQNGCHSISRSLYCHFFILLTCRGKNTQKQASGLESLPGGVKYATAIVFYTASIGSDRKSAMPVLRQPLPSMLDLGAAFLLPIVRPAVLILKTSF